jgi:3-keto-disaccharide hydrolase
MSKTIFLIVVTIALLSCKEKNNATMEEIIPAEVQESSAVPEWQVLFDGTNFDAWRGYLSEEMPSEWTLEEGAMAFSPGSEGGKNIITKDKFTNFVLSLEWKIAEGGNSGIFWGVFEDPKFPEAYQTGPEIQVLDNERHPDAKVNAGSHTAGSLYDMVAPSVDVTKPAGEWNLCVLEVNHHTNMGSVTLNGVKIVTFSVEGEGWDSMVAHSKFKDWEGFGKYPTGHIGLQDHGDKVWYRNIKIKNLD